MRRLLLCLVLLCGCSSQRSPEEAEVGRFKTVSFQKVDGSIGTRCSFIFVIKDEATGQEYLVVQMDRGVAVTPVVKP